MRYCQKWLKPHETYRPVPGSHQGKWSAASTGRYPDLMLPASARRTVQLRDNHQCQSCGIHADDIQHRIARGMGGTSNPDIETGLANLISLCRPCHNLCETRDLTMHERGLWLYRHENPTQVPVITWDHRTIHLHNDGTWNF